MDRALSKYALSNSTGFVPEFSLTIRPYAAHTDVGDTVFIYIYIFTSDIQEIHVQITYR